MNVEASAPFEAVYTWGVSGAVGTVEVAMVDNDGVTIIGPTTNDITETIIDGVGTGTYTWNCPAAPAALGQYTIYWSPDGTWDAETVSTPDEVVVVAAGATGVLPPIPLPDAGGLGFGPTTAWTTVDAVGVCCNAEVGTDFTLFEEVVDQASQLLFELSGRRWIGTAQKTVRPPCCPGCDCGCQVLSRGHIVEASWGACDSGPCDPSRVLLSGYPVREITQVKIDGVVLADTEYRLDGYRWAVRKNNGVWPQHQNLSLDDTEDDTWSISYSYGKNPPLAGQAAAAELACELFKLCTTGECALPKGVSRISRQGIVIEKLAFTAWGVQGGIWRTGLSWIDAFLNAYNPQRLSRRPSVWSPDGPQYARVVGS